MAVLVEKKLFRLLKSKKIIKNNKYVTPTGLPSVDSNEIINLLNQLINLH